MTKDINSVCLLILVDLSNYWLSDFSFSWYLLNKKLYVKIRWNQFL